MLKVQPLQLAAGEARQFLRVLQIAFLGYIGRQPGRHNVDLARGFERHVLFVGMEGHRHRSRQRPGRGGPDDGRDFLARQRGINLRRIIEQRVLHPDAWRGVVLVFNFGFGQRRLVVHAPIDGAQALVHEVVFVKAVKGLEHHRLVLRIHGGVGTVETPEDADPLELLALQVEKLFGKLAALPAHVERAHLQLLAAEHLVDLDLDGQAVAVPSRDIRSVESRHGLGLDHEILQTLVERGAQMDGSAGVGRPIVQDIKLGAAPGLANTLVNPHLLPAGQSLGLVLGQVGLHGKAGLRQVDGGFQVQRHSVGFSPND